MPFGGLRVVILGTGTAVGKTYVTRALAAALAAADPAAPIAALKPIESGLQPGARSDAASLTALSRHVVLPSPHPLYGFREPLTPYLAALREGEGPIELSRIVRWMDACTFQKAPNAGTAADARRGWTLLETAGGVFSPLAPGLSNFELARALEPCVWLLVAPDALGVLHELRATLEALAARGRRPDHVVLSAARGSDASTGSNQAVLESLAIARPSAVLGPGQEDLSDLVRALGVQP